jgi:hypothetical protein
VQFKQEATDFKTEFKNLQAPVTPQNFQNLLRLLKAKNISSFSGIDIETEQISTVLPQILSNNIALINSGYQQNTTGENVSKYLHWFQWEKRDLHLYNIVCNTYRVIKLNITTKVSPFSRSIML